LLREEVTRKILGFAAWRVYGLLESKQEMIQSIGIEGT
jgi:hypothetical protein